MNMAPLESTSIVESLRSNSTADSTDGSTKSVTRPRKGSTSVTVVLSTLLIALALSLSACDSSSSDDEIINPELVSGIVREPAGRVVRGATVTVVTTGQQLTTNTSGEFSFNHPVDLEVCLEVVAGVAAVALCADPEPEGEPLNLVVVLPVDPGEPFTCDSGDLNCQETTLPVPDGTACAGTPDCGFGKTCFFQAGSCGSMGELGQCFARPQECPDDFSPVCACDGQTYDNECSAISQGISIFRPGFC